MPSPFQLVHHLQELAGWLCWALKPQAELQQDSELAELQQPACPTLCFSAMSVSQMCSSRQREHQCHPEPILCDECISLLVSQDNGVCFGDCRYPALSVPMLTFNEEENAAAAPAAAAAVRSR